MPSPGEQTATNASGLLEGGLEGGKGVRVPRIAWGPVAVISLGHGATHWLAAVFYLLLPYIRTDLGFDYAQAGLLVSVFYAASFIANFPSGVVVDLTGRHIAWLILALFVGGIAMFGMGLMESYLAVACAVALIGATNVLWHPAAISYLSEMYPKRRGFVLSIHGLGASMGDATGPMIAGLLMLVLTWQGTAMTVAVLSPLVGVLLWLVVRGSDSRVHIEKAPSRSYLKDMWGLMRRRAIWSLCLMAGFRTVTQIGLLAFLPLYLADDIGLGPAYIGLVLMAMQLGGAVASPLAGILSDRVGRRRVIMAGLGGSTIMVLFLPFIDNAVGIVVLVSLLGFFLLAVRPVIHSWAMDMSPANLGGSMVSLLFGTQASLTLFMPVIGGLLADAYGLIAVFYFLGGMILLSNMAALLIPRGETVR